MMMQAARFDVVIVGAGQAGGQCAAQLRELGFAGSIAVLGAENALPYERPPLSKEYLAGEQRFEQFLIRPRQFWADNRIELFLGEQATSLDAPGRLVCTDAGRAIFYGVLVWAAGCEPRRLSCRGGDLRRVHVLRTKADVEGILNDLSDAARIAIIGGGYIGLEAAAVLTKLGRSVVVYEAQDRLLARVAGSEVSRFFEQEHVSHGVEVHTNACVEEILGRNGAVRAVRTADGVVEAADLVLVGIGVVPVVAPLLRAGAEAGDGVHVDEICRTSLPNVYAIGDCAARLHPLSAGGRVRLESYPNANEMANIAATAIVGGPAAAAAAPWFWSNQYDLQLQSVGLFRGFDEAVVRGDPDSRSFSVAYLREGRVLALDCVNASRDYVQGRALVGAGARLDAGRFRNISIPVRQAPLA